jgi:hypothetical protein
MTDIETAWLRTLKHLRYCYSLLGLFGLIFGFVGSMVRICRALS